jgi:D-alanine transfer protein
MTITRAAIPRWPVRAVALALGSLLFAASFFSPVADLAVASCAFDQGAVASRRDLFYQPVDWFGDPGGYAAATADQPADRASVMVMGSSELESLAPENPRIFLPANVSDFDLFMSGRGYTQSLYHAIELAAMAGDLRDKKVVLIVSPQWFTSQGIDPVAFQALFSEPAWQGMLHNPLLLPQTKEELIARVSTLMKGASGFDAPSGNGMAGDAAHLLFMPFNQVIRRAQTLRIKCLSAQLIAKSSLPYKVAAGSVPVDQFDWSKARALAETEGTVIVHNEFDIADPYFATYIKPRLSQLKDSLRTTDYAAASPEDGDLGLFLDVARDLGVRVLLVSVPMSGRWFDYAGYDAARRSDYYAKIRAIADRPGVGLADFSQDEYTPFFLYDTQHLGWKGWLDVIQACLRFQRS